MTHSSLREIEVITLVDLVRFIVRSKKWLWKVACVGSLFGMGIALYRAPLDYKILATFAELGETHGAGGGSVLQGLLEVAGANVGGPQIVVLMTSRQVLKPLVARLGLQVKMGEESSSALGSWWNHIKACVTAERGRLLEEPERGLFSHVSYEGDVPFQGFLRFSSSTEYQVFSSHRELISTGRVGERLVLDELAWVVVKSPSHLLLHHDYPLQIRPWVEVVGDLQARILITLNKKGQSVYDLCLRYPIRAEGQQILNRLMEEYRLYLRHNHETLAQEQLFYLEKRQDHLYQELEHAFSEYTGYFERNLMQNGCIDFEQDAARWLEPHRTMMHRLNEIDVELTCLQSKPDLPYLGSDRDLLTRLHEIASQCDALRAQRDMLGLAFLQKEVQESDALLLSDRIEALQDVRQTREALTCFLTDLETTHTFPSLTMLPMATPPVMMQWIDRLKASSVESCEGRDFMHFMREHVHLLSMKEKYLQDRCFQGRSIVAEIEGIDPESAHTLFVQYNEKIDDTEGEIRYLRELLGKFAEREFEVSSLGSVLSDPISQTLIDHASQASFSLKDAKHHSTKEEARLTEELGLQKELLHAHLTQLISVKEVHQAVLKEKIENLKTLSLESIQRNLALLEDHRTTLLQKKCIDLTHEKDLLRERILNFRAQMTHLPQKWQQEKLLHLKTQLGVEAFQAITPVIEAKTVGHHLHSVASRPLDEALLPTAPMKPRLMLLAAVGGGVSAIFALFIALLRALYQGFPASREKLLAMRYPWIGSIAASCDGVPVETFHMEAIRLIAARCQQRRVTLLSGKGPNYSHALAEILGRAGKRVLLVQCDWLSPSHVSEPEGLLHWFESGTQIAPISFSAWYDLMPRGGSSPFGMELLLSARFQQLLETWESSYDQVILFVRAPLESSEARAALLWSQQMFVTVRQESMELLTPFVAWAYHEGQCRLSLITCDE